VMADDPVIDAVDAIVVQLPSDADADDGVVRRLAGYLGARVRERPNNRVELRLE